MGKKSKSENTISLEKLITNGPVIEKFDDINESIYRDVYKSAMRQTEEIVRANKEYNIECRKSKKQTFEGSNVISFIGRRGTGKTSAMLSFAEMLNEYTRAGDYSPAKDFFENRELMGKTAFYSLDMVDASAQEESDDIFLIILSYMFRRAESLGKDNLSKISEFDNRQLFQKFERVYNDFSTLNTNVRAADEYGAFEKLRNIAGSQKIRESFADLVREFLKVNTGVYSEDYENSSSYLVIMIDDIDMTLPEHGNTKSGWGTYKIMNSIYKYLRVPNVIVLITYNDQRLLLQCKDFFENTGIDKIIYDDQKTVRAFEEKQQHITVEFIEKVIPVFARVYMPSWKKRDFNNAMVIKAEHCISNLPKEFEEKSFLIKNFLFILLARKTGIYFDIKGKKHHFYEPETLRELYNSIQFLLDMKTCENNQSLDEVLEFNLKRMKEDCYFRFKEEKIVNLTERYFFEELLEEPLERRGGKVIRHICFEIEKLGKRAKRNSEKTGNRSYVDNHKISYSYAELIHGIYHLTRNTPGASRQFVAMLLYSYTIQLTELYARYRSCKMKLQRENHRKLYRYAGNSEELNSDIVAQLKNSYSLLKGVIGCGVCCQWAEYFFPEIEIKTAERKPKDLLKPPKSGPYIIGYVENNYLMSSTMPFMKFEYTDMNEEALRKNLQVFLLKAMMYTNVFNWTKNNIAWNTANNINELKMHYLSMDLDTGNSDFDVTGIFKYTFCYGEFLGKMEHIMIESLKESPNVGSEIYENVKKMLGKCFDRLWEEYEAWDWKYGNMMIPLYSLDITYNIIKRVFQEKDAERNDSLLLEDIVQAEEVSDVFLAVKEYKKMLDRFIKHLQFLDEKYQIWETSFSFEKAYTECPAYRFIKNNMGDKMVASNLYRFFFRIAMIFETEEEDFFSPIG